MRTKMNIDKFIKRKRKATFMSFECINRADS